MMEDAQPTTQQSSFLDGTSCRKNLFQDFEDLQEETFWRENIRTHPIIKTCLGEKCGDGNLWNGGLGVGVYIRIKLSETSESSECSEEYLKNALEILWTRLQKEADPSNDRTSHNESWHLSILSNPFLGSRCLLVSLLRRLDQHEEACEVAFSVLAKLGDLVKRDTCNHSDRDCSVLFGLGGALQVIWFLRKELDDATFGRDLALTLSSKILLEGLQNAERDGNCTGDKRTIFLWKWNGWPYLGTGTGSVGILYALLGHTEEEWEDLGECLPNAKGLVKNAIDDLANHRYESSLDSDSVSGRGNLKDSLLDYEPNESASTCDWTHGAPGYCLLLLKAFDIYGDERFFFHARDLADSVIWKRWQHIDVASPFKKETLGLAKGVSGIAYVYLAMARVDWRDRNIWIHRARELAMLATSQDVSICDETSFPKALFDGIGGLASLLIDTEMAAAASNEAYFPFFEACQSNSNPRRLQYNSRPQDHVFGAEINPSTKQKQMQNHIQPKNYSENITKASPAITRAGKSTAETEITQALTESIATKTPAMNMYNNDGGISLPLDVSQLTEPSLIEVTSQRSLVPPPILEINEGMPQPIIKQPKFNQEGSPESVVKHERPPKNIKLAISSFSCSKHDTDSNKTSSRALMLRRTRVEKQHVRRHIFQVENTGKDDCSAFMTDSVKRIQRAEASWIRHFGTQRETEQRHLDGRFQSSTKSIANSSFRRAMGGFFGVPN